MKIITKLVMESTGQRNAGFHFGQQMSIVIQRGNATSIQGICLLMKTAIRFLLNALFYK